MVKGLISKAEFARRAGVSAAAITKGLKPGGRFAAAAVGKRIDVAHPAAVAYLEGKTNQPEEAATGIDPRYQDAVDFCTASGRYTASAIQKGLGVGFDRAKKILELMSVAGVVPAVIPKTVATPDPVTPAPLPPVKKPALRGYGAKNERKKRESLAEIAEGRTLHEVPDDILAFADMTLRELVQRFGTDVAFRDWLTATKSIEDINEKRLKNAKTKGELVSRDLVKLGIIDPIDAAHIKLLTDGAKTIARRVTAMTNAGRPLEDCEAFVKDQITSFIRPIKAKVRRTLKDLEDVEDV